MSGGMGSIWECLVELEPRTERGKVKRASQARSSLWKVLLVGGQKVGRSRGLFV